MRDLAIEELWELYVDTKSLEVRNEIVTRNLGLAQYVANRYRSRVPDHQSIEDLVSYAYEGLIDAVEKFEPHLGFKFPTYAVRRISGAILDGLRKEDPLPRSARKRVKDYESVHAIVFEMTGTEPTTDEMAMYMRMSAQQIGEIQRDTQSQFKSLDTLETPTIADTRHEDPDLYSQMAEISNHLALKLSALDEVQRSFILAHYGRGMTLSEIADMMDAREPNLAKIRKEIMITITGGPCEED